MTFSDSGCRYDLHLHSEASPDCQTSYRALIRMTRRRGLAGIALCDHDTIDGARQLAEIWPHTELQLITGCERTLADGSHVIGLFVKQVLTAQSPRELVAEIREQGGIILVPHPFRQYSGVAGEASTWSDAERDELFRAADLIEVFNPKCTPDENRRAVELAHTYQKSFTASSDGHRQHEIGMACTVFDGPLSPQNIRVREVLAPPVRQAARLAALRREESPVWRKSARAMLAAAGILSSVKKARDSLKCYSQPKLEKYL